MTKIDPAGFIRSQQYGVLSTHSQSEKGYPFGSITPYIITPKGDIAIFISQLAEHTHNIEANSKVSLTIFDPSDADNPSAGTRVTCLAKAELTSDDLPLRKQYLSCFPEMAITLKLPDFHFYSLTLTKIRLVAGFGQVKWLNASSLNL